MSAPVQRPDEFADNRSSRSGSIDDVVLPDGAGRIVAGKVADPICERASGTAPRNRQLRMMEYVFKRETVCIIVALTNPPVKILDRNPYRTQLAICVYNAQFNGTIFQLSNSNDDGNNNHSVIAGELWPQGVGPGPYAQNFLLSFPVHGPMVCEEWWARASQLVNVDMTGWNYSD